MKRLLLFCVFCVFAFVANAQVRTFYYKDSGYWVKLDLTKKVFILDGCASEPLRVLNYKKTGNKESFTTTDDGLTTHYEFVKKSDTDYTYYYWTSPSESKEKAVIEVTTKPVTIKDELEEDKPTETVAEKNPIKSVSDGVKGLFNKGKSLFKKDKSKGSSNAGKSIKAPKSAPVDDGSMPEK